MSKLILAVCAASLLAGCAMSPPSHQLARADGGCHQQTGTAPEDIAPLQVSTASYAAHELPSSWGRWRKDCPAAASQR